MSSESFKDCIDGNVDHVETRADIDEVEMRKITRKEASKPLLVLRAE